MAILNGYSTLAQFKARYLGDKTITGGSAEETMIEQMIQAISRLIDLRCDRVFFAGSPGVVRYFTPYARCRCIIDDASAVSKIEVDTAGAGTWATELTVNDYWLTPQNQYGHPYQEIELTPWAANSFVANSPRYVKVTGTWGWAAVPDVVREACLLQSFRLYKRQAAPFGVTGTAEFGQAIAIAKLDPDVELMLAPLVRVK